MNDQGQIPKNPLIFEMMSARVLVAAFTGDPESFAILSAFSLNRSSSAAESPPQRSNQC